ncbi:phosphatidylserine decarboxylase [Sutcliffiella rhizosphaerae]|uniref:Phosphatidylserine decarboxylase proenzyme n=1 Tax=Sutcliffiella rhizosphaerae TaxID=2880967 RepID=A0ABN8A688_9BACI|nr:phosphatidylserine decarboxylase [Sutcliffiella rhizosphaerae]CAG9619397.1 Phosphatidylserine decarboxylase proenzyme [Sutcliffiella rhizosphaerae]
MLKGIYRIAIELTNHKLSSMAVKHFAGSKISKRFIPSFAKVYNINTEEMQDNINEFPTLQQFFIRNLKPTVRPIDSAKNSVVSPVDAVVEKAGRITDDLLLTAKGIDYSVGEMLSDPGLAEKYMGGTYMVLYLSPSHYHKIHTPISGEITKQWTLGGKSYPVNQMGLKYGKEPLAKNYRRLTEIACEGQHVVVVKVGAMFVNSIELTHQSDRLVKGEEMAYFSFGSTVILLFEKDVFHMEETIREREEVKVGQRIGTWIS